MRTLLVFFCLLATHAAAAQPAPGTCAPGTDTDRLPEISYHEPYYDTPLSNDGSFLAPDALRFSLVQHSGLWVAGRVGAGARQAVTFEGTGEFWPGPLAPGGSAPDCQAFDRVYVVTDADLRRYRFGGGSLASDLRDWPVGLGAPTYLDLNDDYVWNAGEPPVTSTDPARTIDLAAGERPDVRGGATAWWVLNDVGNAHALTGSPPLGLEVQVTAYTRNSGKAAADPHGTYFRLRLVYRGSTPLTEAWLGFHADLDAAGYAGFDAAREVAYFYEPSPASEQYWARAAGIRVERGPLVRAPGQSTRDPDGTLHPDTLRRAGTRFIVFTDSLGGNGPPRPNTEDFYRYLQGRWQDGTALQNCGDGFDESAACGPADFMWTGDPLTGMGWSEFNPYPAEATATPRTPGPRNVLLATGPFSLQPGETQEVGFTFFRALGSEATPALVALRKGVDRLTPEYEAIPELLSPAEGETLARFVAHLEWTELAGAAGYDVQVALSRTFETLVYDARVPWLYPQILPGAGGLFYWRVRAVYDDAVGPWSEVGTFRTPALAPPIPRTPEDGATLPPGALDLVWSDALNGQGLDVAWQLATDADFTQVVDSDTGSVLRAAPIVAAAGQRYYWRVRYLIGDAARNPLPWSEAYSFTTRADALVYQPQVVTDLLTVASAAGPLDPPEYAAFATDGNGFPHPTTAAAPDGARQQSTGGLRSDQGWALFTFGERQTFDEWLVRVTQGGTLVPNIVGRDYEWRFTGASLAWKKYEDSTLVSVPFELWDIGKTPADPRDDVRLIPVLCESPCTGVGVDGTFDLAGDTPLDEDADDPITDGVYWFRPADATPGEAGYQRYAREASAPVPSFSAVGDEVWRRFSLVGLNFGAGPPYPQALPEAGTVFRIVTGDVRVDAPVLTGPANEATVRQHDLLTWIVPEGIASVTLQVAEVPDFSRTVVDFDLGPARSTGVPSSEPGVYYWRVRSKGLVSSAWSEVRSYRIGTPTEAAPGEALPAPQELTVSTFPNPSAGRVTFRFGLDVPRPVRLVLYDLTGRQVAVVRAAPLPAGWHEVPFEGGGLPSGLYLYRLTTDAATRTGAVVLVR